MQLADVPPSDSARTFPTRVRTAGEKAPYKQLDLAVYAWLVGILRAMGQCLGVDTCLHGVLLHIVVSVAISLCTPCSLGHLNCYSASLQTNVQAIDGGDSLKNSIEIYCLQSLN